MYRSPASVSAGALTLEPGQSKVQVLLAVADIQELGQVGSYMLDIMDIIISEKEFFNNIVFL